MAQTPRYKRVVLKVSGESFSRPGELGIDAASVQTLIGEIAPVVEMGVQVAIVAGGGNLVRARDLSNHVHIERVTADSMGMLATVINGLALRDSLESNGISARIVSAISMPAICERYTSPTALRHLDLGRVLILTAGTGNPFFTTDTGASLRACELNADVLLKATQVDGVYDADPETNANAKRYDRLTYEQVLKQRLGVMDLSAVSMCMGENVPIVVFALLEAGNLARVVRGEDIGTWIGPADGDN